MISVNPPKVWFAPNGKGSWELIASKKALDQIVDNCNANVKCCFEAIVPSLGSPSSATTMQLLCFALAERRQEICEMARIVGSVAIFGIIITLPLTTVSVLQAVITLLAILIPSILLTRKYVLKVDCYSNVVWSMGHLGHMIPPVSAINIPYEMSYSSFLESIKNVIDEEDDIVSVREEFPDEAKAFALAIDEIDHQWGRRNIEHMTKEAREVYSSLKSICSAKV